MEKHFKNYAPVEAAAVAECQYIKKNGVRISVLTSRLIRVEVQNSSVFCDKPTQAVLNRSFDSPRFTCVETGKELKIITDEAEFLFSFQKRCITTISFRNGNTVTDFSKENLKGTCRTLDNTDGKTHLEDGILSKTGVGILDDSTTLIISEDGTIQPRKVKGKDLYYFAYGHDYNSAICDYFRLTGFPPLIPRFTLGNWWSRYKAYTQKEYTELMHRFIREKIPITVATIDMDWHWVNVVGKFGPECRDIRRSKGPIDLFYNVASPGWTGYSWNTDLFPEPDEFLKELKNCGFRVTMNLHPASGCKYYEDAYPLFAEFMGVDKSSKTPIPFDITDPKFVEGYFRYLHHPHEENGVDFWWIDWQQGKKTAIPGLDPLWALNHYHSVDSTRDGKRPLILSRFAGAGSHRYPLGFSGDTAQSWKTLAFQPYFTATASNIGYTWWSHDIGGHHFGIRDDELYLRWVQLGVFSPIMRLHSTSNEFMGKEPWKYASDVCLAASEMMRLRHRLIPYIYTANYQTAFRGIPLIRPMYYSYPEEKEAYEVPNEYFFGSELIACPVTVPCNEKTGLAAVKVYLPEGRYTDVLSDRIYLGGKTVTLYRDKGSFPLLAKEGAIIPLDMNRFTNDCKNPEKMELLVYRGNSSYTMYEDDGETLEYKNGKYFKTKFTLTEDGNMISFTIEKDDGDESVVPEKRDYRISFRDVTSAEKICITVNGKEQNVIIREDSTLCVILDNILPTDFVEIILDNVTVRHSPDKKETKIETISKLQGSNGMKNKYLKFLDNKYTLPDMDILSGPLKETEYFF